MERFRAGLPLRATRSDVCAPTGPMRVTYTPECSSRCRSVAAGGRSIGHRIIITQSGRHWDVQEAASSNVSPSEPPDSSVHQHDGRKTEIVHGNGFTQSEPSRKTQTTPSTAATVASESEDSSDPEEVDQHVNDAGSSEPPKQTRFLVRMQYTKGSASGLDEADADQEVSDRIQELKWAASGAYNRRSRETWWLRWAAQRGIEAYPLTPESLKLAVGLLRKGAYRSAEMYLSTRHIQERAHQTT